MKRVLALSYSGLLILAGAALLGSGCDAGAHPAVSGERPQGDRRSPLLPDLVLNDVRPGDLPALVAAAERPLLRIDGGATRLLALERSDSSHFGWPVSSRGGKVALALRGAREGTGVWLLRRGSSGEVEAAATPLVLPVHPHLAPFELLTVDEDATRVLRLAVSNQLELWDVGTGALLAAHEIPRSYWRGMSRLTIWLDRSGARIARLWDRSEETIITICAVAPGKPLKCTETSIGSSSFPMDWELFGPLADGRLVAVYRLVAAFSRWQGSRGKGRLVVVAGDGAVEWRYDFPDEGSIEDIGLSPDGMLVIRSSRLSFFSEDGMLVAEQAADPGRRSVCGWVARDAMLLETLEIPRRLILMDLDGTLRPVEGHWSCLTETVDAHRPVLLRDRHGRVFIWRLGESTPRALEISRTDEDA